MKYLTISFFYAALIGFWFGGAQATEVRIHIPDASGMGFTANFQGHILQLQGQLLAVSRPQTLDDEVEFHVSLLFQPTPEARKRLPVVRYDDETDEQNEIFIELNGSNGEQLTQVIEGIFGTEIATNAGKSAFEVGKQGYLRLQHRMRPASPLCGHRVV